jgi:hypothetical protein
MVSYFQRFTNRYKYQIGLFAGLGSVIVLYSGLIKQELVDKNREGYVEGNTIKQKFKYINTA